MKKYLLILAPLIGVMIGWLMTMVAVCYGPGIQTFGASLLCGAVIWCLTEIVLRVES